MNIETPYDEESNFIDCKLCNKSIRGDTLYKIHLTTPGHIKKEDIHVSMGLAVRQHVVPTFRDICHYVDYLKLDEPIIGLGYLEEIPSFDPQTGPNYICKLCNQKAALANMVNHVIGRKHRLKYIEDNRSDLVTWDGLTVGNHGGKVMRAKAEIIERQDGRGTPKAMVKRGLEGKLNISGVSQKQSQKRDLNIPHTPLQAVPPLLPEFKDYQRKKTTAGCSKTPAFYPVEPNGSKNRSLFSNDQDERMNYRESPEFRKDYTNPNFHSSYENEYAEDPQRSEVLGPQDGSRYGYNKKMPQPPQVQDVERYLEKAAPYKRPYPERDALQEFYAEEVRRGQLRSQECQPSQMTYPEGDKKWWSLESNSDRHDGANRTLGQGSSEPGAKRRNMSTLDSDQLHHDLFSLTKDYHHDTGKRYEQETFDTPGPSRAGASTSQRRIEVSNTISNMPEPFQRFLKGGPNNEAQRKRKSRFTDATPEELEMTKKIFRDGYKPSYAETGGNPRQGGAPMRPEISGTQYSDLYGGLQSHDEAEDFHRGGSKSQGVFDMLRNVEIETEEEAEFLKSKLCNLLKEFKTKKQEKAALDSQSRAGMSKNYGELTLNPHLPQKNWYERNLKEESDHRRPEAFDFGTDRLGQKWNELMSKEQYKEYPREPSHSNRHHYDGSRASDLNNEPPRYPDMFEEPQRLRDYKPAAEFYEPQSSAPSLQMEQMANMQRDPRFSRNLDKITSALLELVSRK